MINFDVPKSQQRKFERELKRYMKKNRKEFEHRVNQATAGMHKMAVNNAPRKNGDLRENIIFGVDDRQLEGEVISNAEYSAAVEKGTKPHVIRPVKKKVLANPETGEIFGKKVNHPGTTAQPFLYPAWKKAQKDFLKGLRRVFK